MILILHNGVHGRQSGNSVVDEHAPSTMHETMSNGNTALWNVRFNFIPNPGKVALSGHDSMT